MENVARIHESSEQIHLPSCLREPIKSFIKELLGLQRNFQALYHCDEVVETQLQIHFFKLNFARGKKVYVSKFAISFFFQKRSFKILITILFSEAFQSYDHHQAT